MKNFVGIFTILALLITTVLPAASHAMPQHKAEASKILVVGENHDCHGHGSKDTDNKAAQNDASDKCCDKGMCKCVGGNCHSLSKYFGNGANSLAAVSSSSNVFAFDNQFVDSALPNRLKRPPKA